MIEADGMFDNKSNQNLWVYTADCMPILFADKRKRFIAAVHCGRKGLETKIIKNLLRIFYELGSDKEDIIVAIGPSISKENYVLDNKILTEFYKNTNDNRLIIAETETKNKFELNNFKTSTNKSLTNLDLKECAYMQLINENIPNGNIDISNLCTYESKEEFNSWRRTKTFSRQWSFIGPN